jgi:hypothetical protein
MKRIATLIFYAIGAVAIAYLALYAYAMLSGRNFYPGEPIRIFRNPDAPSYSGTKNPVREARTGSKVIAEGRDVTPSPRRLGDRCCRLA